MEQEHEEPNYDPIKEYLRGLQKATENKQECMEGAQKVTTNPNHTPLVTL